MDSHCYSQYIWNKPNKRINDGTNDDDDDDDDDDDQPTNDKQTLLIHTQTQP